MYIFFRKISVFLMGVVIMRAIYFKDYSDIDCDVLLEALLDLGVDISELQDTINALGLPGYKIIIFDKDDKILASNKIHIDYIDGEFTNKVLYLNDIEELIDSIEIKESRKIFLKNVFTNLMQFEANVKSANICDVFMDEVLVVRHIVEVIALKLCIDLLDIRRVFSAPIETDKNNISISGMVVLVSIVCSFRDMPIMTIEKIGYGMAKREAGKTGFVKVIMGTLLEEDILSDEKILCGYSLNQLV